LSRSFVTHLECGYSGERYDAGIVQTVSAAGKPLLVRYDLGAIARAVDRDAISARSGGFWRFRELLPLADRRHELHLGEVTTPLVRLARSEPRGGALFVKDESRLPTGSFKARGVGIAVAKAKELGIGHIAMPTNGNAGAALAAYAARAGIRATVFCPADTPDVNVREIAAQGAAVYRVPGLIDECGRIVGEGKKALGWFDLSTLKEPYRIEGKKTMGLELAEQFDWRLPEAIFYPTGGGTGLIGMWKAFAELAALGWATGPLPRLFAIQASGCAPIVRAFERGERHAEAWRDAQTIAAGIRVPAALGDFLILDAVRESAGAALAVDDAAIVAAQQRVAHDEGLLLCPEGAATFAGWQLARKRGLVAADARVVLFNCATALKYPLPEAAATFARGDSFERLRSR